MEFVLISFKPEVRKTLNINIFGYVSNIIIEVVTFCRKSRIELKLDLT